MLFWQIVTLIFLSIHSISCKRVYLTCAQKQAFVDGHNARRHRAAQGLVPRQPPAADMMYMVEDFTRSSRSAVWDEELAEKAAKWAENGVFAHNPDRSIGSRRWHLVGENVYISKYYSSVEVNVRPNIDEALEAWFSEHENYGFEPFALGTPKPIGHYTQMVWAATTRVGCGISQRKENGETSTLFVCDYGPTGNYIGQVPYSYSPIKGYLRCIKGTCNKPYGKYC